MASKPALNKWKSVSKSVVGVLATKIAVENPDKIYDNLKSYLEKTKKQVPELASMEGTREMLEERILKLRAIIVTFESRKNQLENLSEGFKSFSESIDTNESNETVDNYETFRADWTACEEELKKIVQDSQLVLDEWRNFDELNDKIDNLFNQFDSRRQSCCNTESAIDIASRLQQLKEENSKNCDSIFKKLKNVIVYLMEKCKQDELVKVIDDVEEKMSKTQTEISNTINSLEKRVEEERQYVLRKENFFRTLEDDIEVLKNIRNQECDTVELQACLILIKQLKEKWYSKEIVLQEIDRQTKSLTVERYTEDFDHVFQIWTKYTEDLNMCQENLELQTNESRKVVYLLISAEREIVKKQYDLNKLQRNPPVDKIQLEENMKKVSESLKNLSSLYGTMENFTHQWEKLKKSGFTDDKVELKLQKASENLNLLQYDFQNLLDKYEEILTVVVRVDEDCEKISKSVGGFSGYLVKVRLNEEDTNSDIQAKMSKIDQKLWAPFWGLLENAESLVDSLPKEFACQRSKVEQLKLSLEKVEKDFENVGKQLSNTLTCLNEFVELCTKLNCAFVEMRESMPNLKKLTGLNDSIKAHNEFKSIEENLKSIKLNELPKITNIQTTLALVICKKPAKDVTNKWKDLMGVCLDSIFQLSQDIQREQTKVSKQAEFKEWLDSTKDVINQSIINYDTNTFGDLESLQKNLVELRNLVVEKTTDLKDFDLDAEREEIKTQMLELLEMLNNSLEQISSTSVVWQEFDHQLTFLSSWFTDLQRRADEAKLLENMKEKIYTLKEVALDLQSKESKINDLNDKAQTLNSMTNSFSVVQQTCSLINSKSQLGDEIEAQIQSLERWSFIRSQLKSMIHQISIIGNRLQSIVVANEDLEDDFTTIDEINQRLSVVNVDIEKMKNSDDFQRNVLPIEIEKEFSYLNSSFDQLKQDLTVKWTELQKLIDYANEQRLLSIAKSHECSPAVYETVDELHAGYEVHYLSGRNASLKLNKYGKFRNRTGSSGLMRRAASKKGLHDGRKNFSESESNFSKYSSIESSVETVSGVTLSLAEIFCPGEISFAELRFPLSHHHVIERAQTLPTMENCHFENEITNFCMKSLDPVELATAQLFPSREQNLILVQDNVKLETVQRVDDFAEKSKIDGSLPLNVPSGDLSCAADYTSVTPRLCTFHLPIQISSSEVVDSSFRHIATTIPIAYNKVESSQLLQHPLVEKTFVETLFSADTLSMSARCSLESNFPIWLATTIVGDSQSDENMSFANHEFAYAYATNYPRLASASVETPVEHFVTPDRATLWNRLHELAAKVRSVDLHTPGRLASATLKVLLAYLEYVHLLWHVHGNVDIFNFDEIDLHQSIQFLQLDILQLIEDCQRIIVASSILDSMVSCI